MARKRTRKRADPPAFRMHSDVTDSLQKIEKRYAGGVYKGNEKPAMPRIRTGIFVLDYALLGGIPVNSATMVLGEKHGGKSLLAFKLIANAQAQFPKSICVLVDTERSFDAVWAEKLGVDTERLLVIEAHSGEQAVDQAALFANSEGVSLLVVDSLASLVPFKEVDTSAEDNHIGLQARLIASMIRRLTQALINSRQYGPGITIVYVNQFRAKIGGFVVGDPRKPAGGNFPEYAAGLMLIMKNKENKAGGGITNEHIRDNTHSFLITKNKHNNGPRSGEFVVIRENDPERQRFEGMVDDADTLLAYAKRWDVFVGRKPNSRILLPGGEVNCISAARGVLMLKEDSVLYKALRDHLIALEAQKWQMPESFIETIEMEDYEGYWEVEDDE